MSSSLLPPNASKLERDIEQVIASSLDLPLSIADLWDPFRCPLSLLPWLAWAYSVDQWEDSWPESVKRQVVNDAFDIHRFKGTPYAVHRALNSLGINTKILEWWEQGGSQQPGTVQIDALVSDAGIDLNTLLMISSAIANSKRGVIHHAIRTMASSNGASTISCASMSASIATISYYTLSELTSNGCVYVSAGNLIVNIITVENAQ